MPVTIIHHAEVPCSDAHGLSCTGTSLLQPSSWLAGCYQLWDFIHGSTACLFNSSAAAPSFIQCSSRPGWLAGAVSNLVERKVSLHIAGHWNWMFLKVFSNPNCSVILFSLRTKNTWPSNLEIQCCRPAAMVPLFIDTDWDWGNSLRAGKQLVLTALFSPLMLVSVVKFWVKIFGYMYAFTCLFACLLLLLSPLLSSNLSPGKRVTHLVSISLVSVLVAATLLNDYQLWFLSAARLVFLSDVAFSRVQLHPYMLDTHTCVLCGHLTIYTAWININVPCLKES